MSPYEVGFALAVVVVTALLIGYSIGRRVGLRQGKHCGHAEAPLRLRGVAFKTGRCPVCDTIHEPDAWVSLRAAIVRGEYGEEVSPETGMMEEQVVQ